MKIIITIEVPEGVHVNVDQPEQNNAHAENGGDATFVPAFADELIPIAAGAQALPQDTFQPFRGAATGQPNPGLCPVHHMAWTTVPAGISKKTGRAYDAFLACPERGCAQRPA